MSQPLVLVAEDDQELRELIALVVESAGYRVVQAKDGNTAARIATVAQPVAIITDVRMPALNGLELCKLVRLSPGTRHAPVLIVSALSQPRDLQAGFSAGASGYLVKPFSPRDLLHRLEELISGSGPDAEPATPVERQPELCGAPQSLRCPPRPPREPDRLPPLPAHDLPLDHAR